MLEASAGCCWLGWPGWPGCVCRGVGQKSSINPYVASPVARMGRDGVQISTKRTVSPCVPLSIPKTALGLPLQEGDDDNDDDVGAGVIVRDSSNGRVSICKPNYGTASTVWLSTGPFSRGLQRLCLARAQRSAQTLARHRSRICPQPAPYACTICLKF